ncbi:MAG: hypothetical protein C4B57_08105 [Deltaproteobacteria bacterium]|nr:MAG: hypothetical protein C4B57_08105 [Deltaproteobacteria bacterium]
MKDKSKSVFTGTLITIALVLCLAGYVPAHTQWVSGVVTTSPWKERHEHIRVNNVTYTLMPKIVNVTIRHQTDSGIWSEKTISLDDIRRGQKIMIRVQGHRIYQIIVIE